MGKSCGTVYIRGMPATMWATISAGRWYKLCLRISLLLVSFSVPISRGLRVWRQAAARWKVEVIARSTHLGSSKNSLWAWNARQTRNHRRKNQTHILIFCFTRFIIKSSKIAVFSIGNPIQILLKIQWFYWKYSDFIENTVFKKCVWEFRP